MDSLPASGGVAAPSDRPHPVRSSPPTQEEEFPGAVPRGQAEGLVRRFATAAVGIPLTLFLVVAGHLWLLLGVAGVIVVGLIEFYRMAERGGYRPVWEAGIGAGLLFALAAAWPQGSWQPLVFPGFLAYTIGVQLRSGRPGRAMVNTAVTLLGAVYVGYLFSYVIRLRNLPIGPGHAAGYAPIVLVVLAVWASDSAAYFVGRAAGRHKLLPEISPNKSLEGAAGGVLAGIAAGGVCAWAFRLSLPMAATVGGLCALAGVLGDLWESAIKREVGVKDAGSILPGHGGILDRFDGLLFATVVGYVVMFWWRGR